MDFEYPTEDQQTVPIIDIDEFDCISDKELAMNFFDEVDIDGNYTVLKEAPEYDASAQSHHTNKESLSMFDDIYVDHDPSSPNLDESNLDMKNDSQSLTLSLIDFESENNTESEEEDDLNELKNVSVNETKTPEIVRTNLSRDTNLSPPLFKFTDSSTAHNRKRRRINNSPSYIKSKWKKIDSCTDWDTSEESMSEYIPTGSSDDDESDSTEENKTAATPGPELPSITDDSDKEVSPPKALVNYSFNSSMSDVSIMEPVMEEQSHSSNATKKIEKSTSSKPTLLQKQDITANNTFKKSTFLKPTLLEKQNITRTEKTEVFTSKLSQPRQDHSSYLDTKVPEESHSADESDESDGSHLKPGAQKVSFSSEGGKWYAKENFCKFCLTLVKRIDKHLLSIHANEKPVLTASLLPPRNAERKRILGQLRLEGNDMYNSSKTLNPEGKIICARRQRISTKEHKGFAKGNKTKPKPSLQKDIAEIGRRINTKDAQQHDDMRNMDGKYRINSYDDLSETEDTNRDNEDHMSSESPKDGAVSEVAEKTSSKKINKNSDDYEVVLLRLKCPHCLAYFSYTNLRNHIRLRHSNEIIPGTRQVLALSKQSMSLCHPIASDQVKDHLLQKLKTDDEGMVARHDLVIILFANKFIQKYSEASQLSYVRGHMRLLGRLLIAVQKVNPKINELQTIFRPLYWPTVLKAIHDVCKLDTEKNRYLTIYNAETLPLLIRKCIKILKSYYTIRENDTQLDYVCKFEKVFEDEIEYQVLYKAVLSRKEANRHKNDVQIPKSEDIYTFENYLDLKRSISIAEFEKGNVDLINWTNLVETTACRIVTYNRRRVGEVSKTLMKDYLHARKADPSSEFFKMLPLEEQKQRLKYTRIDIQGKRIDGKGSLYLSRENEYALKLITTYREALGIDKDNPYLFGLIRNNPKEKYQHINLCMIMTRLSKECAKNYKRIEDKSMRGTLLRKQLATFNAAASNGNASLASKHLGHSQNVHHTYYKLTVDGEDVATTKMLDCVNKGLRDEKVSNDNEDITTTAKNDESTSGNDESSGILNSSNESESLKSIFGIKKKLTRKRWSTAEMAAFNKAFKKCLDVNRYATADEIREAQRKYPVLIDRSEKVIRAQFSNILKRNRQ